MMRIKLDLPGREEDVEKYEQMLLNMVKLGINLLCYNFVATGWFRTSKDIQERGGALVTGFDNSDGEKLPLTLYSEVSAEKIWENYKWFIEQVIPVTEKSGVKMALTGFYDLTMCPPWPAKEMIMQDME